MPTPRTCVRALLPLILFATLLSCEDPIDVPTNFEGPQLVVEAWLTNESVPQTITLTETQEFYDSALPGGVAGAEVVVCRGTDATDCAVFEAQGNGRYVWTPPFPGAVLGEVGETFTLGFELDGERYASQTVMKATAEIDSLSFQFEEEALGLEEGFYAQLYARDQPGRGDTYLIRTTFNDTLLLRPSEINTSFDGVFDAGTDADGNTFIFPIRFRINKVDEDGAPVALVEGDSLSIEVWSISTEAFVFLNVAAEQIANGDSGIFGVPVANSPGNVLNVNTGEPILGIFNVAEVARVERVFEGE